MALTVARAIRYELWSTVQAGGGTRLGFLRDIVTAEASSALTGETALRLALPLTGLQDADTGALLTGLAGGQVVRVVESDSVFDEWVIVEIQQDSGAQRVALVAVDPLSVLAWSGIITETGADGRPSLAVTIAGATPTEILTTYVLPAAPAWVALGTITPTGRTDLTLNGATPLEVVRALAQRTNMEVQLRRNGTTNYLLDVVAAVGSSAPVADLRSAKNLASLRYSRSALTQATVLYPRGASVEDEPGTIADALWEVEAIVGSDVQLRDPAGGVGPIVFASQFNGLYLRPVTGTPSLISATSAVTQRVTVATIGLFAVGDRVNFVTDTAGTPLIRLTSPADVSTYGTRAAIYARDDIPVHTNLVPNPAFRLWSNPAVAPEGWALQGAPTVTRSSNAVYASVGPYAAFVEATADGQGLRAPLTAVRPSTGRPFFSGYVRLHVITGKVRVEWEVGSQVFPAGTGKADSSQRLVDIDLGLAGIDLQAVGATTMRLRVVQDGSTAATFYVIAAQLTQSPSQQILLEGSGAVRLWQAANAALVDVAPQTLDYDGEVLDLARVRPDLYAGDADFVLGGTVRLRDSQHGLDGTTRAVELVRDYVVPSKSRVRLSSKPSDLAGGLARPDQEPPPLVSAIDDELPLDEGSVIRNGRFNYGTPGFPARGWRIITGTPVITASVFYDNGQALDMPANSEVRQTFKIVPGLRYLLSGRIRRKSATADANTGLMPRMGVDVTNNDAAVYAMQLREVVGDLNETLALGGPPPFASYAGYIGRLAGGDWQYVSAVMEVPETITNAAYPSDLIELILKGGEDGAYFDQVRVEVVPRRIRVQEALNVFDTPANGEMMVFNSSLGGGVGGFEFVPTGGGGTVTGTGTTNRLAKFTGASAIGDSLLFDNGSSVVVGTDPGGAEFVRIGGSLRIASLVSTGSLVGTSAVIGTDPGGSDLLRVGGSATLGTSGRLRWGSGSPAAGKYVLRAGFGSPVALEVTNADESAYADFRAGVLYGFTAAIVGTDPGGSQPLRIGGGLCANGDSEFVSTSGARQVYLSRPIGTEAYLTFRSGTSARWAMLVNGAAESGSNVGSNFRIDTYSDAGAYLRTNLEIVRSTGNATFAAELYASVLSLSNGRASLSSPSGNGSLSVSDGAVSGQFYAISSRIFAGTNGAVDFGLISSGTERWRVTAGGDFRAAVDNTHDLGAVSSGRPRNLYVGSAIVAGGDITAFSDARLKVRTLPVTGALALVRRLNPVWFHWKARPEAGAQLGLLAQNVRDVVPEVVRTLDDKDRTLTVDYGKLVALLIAAVQELDA